MDSPSHVDSYEIFHDVLARVILDYVTVQDAERAKERVRRQYFITAGLAAGLVLALLLSGFAWWQGREAKRATEHAQLSEAEAKKQARLAQTAEEKGREQARLAQRSEAEAKNQTRLAQRAERKARVKPDAQIHSNSPHRPSRINATNSISPSC